MLSWLFPDLLPAGSAAPDFTLPDQDGNIVALSKLRGRNVLLVFYPGDDTSMCKRQLCELRDRWDLFTARNVLIFGVNPQDAESHARFRAKFRYPFPLLVDKNQRMAGDYNAKGWIVRRTVYLIDGNGIIQAARRGKPDPDAILATLTR